MVRTRRNSHPVSAPSVSRPGSGPLTGARRVRRTAPFGLLGLAVTIAYLATFSDSLTPAEVTAIVALGVSLVVLVVATPWDSLPAYLQLAVPVGVTTMIVLMQVFALPKEIHMAVLLVVPLFWTALYGTRGETMSMTVVVVGAIIALQALTQAGVADVGVSGWTEAIALGGTVILIAYFTVTSRAQAGTDTLTGIANRREWDEILPLEVGRARRYAGGLIVAMIDLDHFKRFNDTRGHHEGDRHLAVCAAVWSRCLRETDVIARVGGEEFAVLLVGADVDDATRVLLRLADATPHGQTCSIGLARWDGREDAPTLMARADQALYAAKEAGRNRIAVAATAGEHEGPPKGGPIARVVVPGV